MKRFLSLILLPTFALLSGCTQQASDLNATVTEAFFGFDDINMSKEEVLSLPYASSYVQISDGQQIFMVLALADAPLDKNRSTELKWISSDKAMIMTQQGRITKTLALPLGDLVQIHHDSTQQVDPLKMIAKQQSFEGFLNPKRPYSWSATYDWMPEYRFNYQAKITWHYVGDEVVQNSVWEKDAKYFQESIFFPALNRTLVNHFWVDTTSFQVIKSIQQVGPGMDTVTMTLLKPFSA